MLRAVTFEERLSVVGDFISTNSAYSKYEAEDVKWAAHMYYLKLVAADQYTPADHLQSSVLLIKAEQTTTAMVEHDYRLSSVCDKAVVRTSPGNHVDFITNTSSIEVATAIGQWFESL